MSTWWKARSPGASSATRSTATGELLARLSTITTDQPAWSSSTAVWLPMYPAPPVRRTVRLTASLFHRPAAALAVGLPLLVLQPPLLGCERRARRAARRLHPQRARDALRKSSQRELSVARLRPLVGGDDAHLGAELRQQALSLPRTEGTRTGDVEHDLDPGVRRVGVLAARSTAAREPPSQLGDGDGARARHVQHPVIHWSDGNGAVPSVGGSRDALAPVRGVLDGGARSRPKGKRRSVHAALGSRVLAGDPHARRGVDAL